MCTVSFVPTGDGFRLAMNRDEKRTRIDALPAEIFHHGKRRAVYPREPGGGTWLAVNDAGLCLALINWHRIEREPKGKLESRGSLIPRLIGHASGVAAGRALRRTNLGRMRPFRFLAFDPRRQTVREWQWDTVALATRTHRWQIAYWFSSGYDEAEAENHRARICANVSLGTTRALRELHRSHGPKRGPFSICMHRHDAVTVSFSEVVVSTKRITFRYQPGAPCECRARVVNTL
jgi:hypothetical protein